MPSTYSNLKIELIATGEQSGTWGATTNTNLGTAIEEAITGSADVTFVAGLDTTITLTDTNAAQAARNLRLNLIGTSNNAQNLILGSGCQIEKLYLINNTLGHTITVKNTTGTGIAVPAGRTAFVYNNGTNVVDAITYLSSLTTTQVNITGQGDLRLEDTSGGEYVALQAPSTLASSYTLTMPVDDGTNGQALITDGSGNLSWSTAASGDVYGPASATDNAIARFDLTTGKLIQNSSALVDDAGNVLAGAGLVGAPAFSTSGDTNTGIFFPAADTIAFSEGGVESMRIDSAGNVGIGTTSPDRRLNVYGSSDVNALIEIGSSLTTAEAVIGVTSGSNTGFVGTFTNNDFMFRTNNTERMRITATGLVGIGTTTPTARLDVSSPSSGQLLQLIKPVVSTGGANIYMQSDSANSGTAVQFNWGSEAYTNGVTGGGPANAYPLTFYTNGTERMRVNAGAPILCLAGGNTSATGTGIAFPATQSASSDANCLDDYEEGNWTPTAPVGLSFSTATYQKIGNTVFLNAFINVNSNSDGSVFLISGLPYAIIGASSSVGCFSSTNTDLYAYLEAGNGIFIRTNGNSSRTCSSLSGAFIAFQLYYRT